MKAVGIKRQLTYAGGYDLKQVITYFSMKTLVIMSICSMCFSVNFTSKTHAIGIDEIKEVWYWVDKLIEVGLELAVDGLAEYNQLTEVIEDYKLIINCQGSEIYGRSYINQVRRYGRDGNLDVLEWGQDIEVELSNPSSMGRFGTSKGIARDYGEDTEWEWKASRIPRGNWDKYIRNGNGIGTEERHVVQYKLRWLGEGHAPSAFDADGISEWIDADFDWAVYHGTYAGRPSEGFINRQIKNYLQNKYAWNSYYDVAEVRRVGIWQTTRVENWCDSTVTVFSDTTLEVSNNAGNQSVETELLEPREYTVRVKCEITPLWDFLRIPTELRVSYWHEDITVGGTGISLDNSTMTPLGNGERYSVVPNVAGSAKRRLVATQHANCIHRCEIHDDYSTDQTITNPACRPVILAVTTGIASGGYYVPDGFNCRIHGDGNLDSVCAANRTRGFSVKQEYHYPRKEN